MQKFRWAVQKFLLLAIFLASSLTITGCYAETIPPDVPAHRSNKAANFKDDYKSSDTWLIQWYLCGTDLESRRGFASGDLQEILNVKLPANVKVLIQTGGTEQWHNNVVSSNSIERYLYDSNGLQRVDSLSDGDMGNADTLAGFLRYGKDNYTADHRVFIFWDHGGGSASGICFDERTRNSLSLNDLRKAFTSVYEPSPDNPPFELIGFDACLMATYDTVNALDGIARYVTASEEVEPGTGWEYTGWLSGLADNPAMGGAKLGKIICDTYIAGCRSQNSDDTATLSVIDLSKLPMLRHSYEAYGMEALRAAYKSPKKFFSQFGRGAMQSENYGGNTRRTGYTNMIDILDLANNTKDIVPSNANKLIDAVDDAVVYKVNGAYRNRGGGLSSFYSYNGDERSFLKYSKQESAPIPQKILYYYLIYGKVPENVVPLLDGDTLVTPAPVTPPEEQHDIFDISQLREFPVHLDSNNNAFVKLSPEQMELLSSIHCQLVRIDIDNDVIIYFGSDADINADWDTGIFTDNFRGVWPMLDGYPVYIEIVEENDGYNLYSIPVKLNGVACNLQVAYVYADEKYYILGARKGLDNNGMSSRELIKLRAGDEITTLHYGMAISSDDNNDFIQVEGDTFTIGDHPQIKDEPIGDGKYAYCFEFLTATEESESSEFILFTVENGEITTEIQ